MRNIDKFRGCLIGGAAGDALGYADALLRTDRIYRCTLLHPVCGAAPVLPHLPPHRKDPGPQGQTLRDCLILYRKRLKARRFSAFRVIRLRPRLPPPPDQYKSPVQTIFFTDGCYAFLRTCFSRLFSAEYFS